VDSASKISRQDRIGSLNATDPWAEQFGLPRSWAVEDCRHLSRRLERDLLTAGESVVRVPPKLMAKVRDSARTFGKSDPIDALAVARAALREPDLPTARLDGPDRELRLLVDHRDALVAERTRLISRLRWHLHELDPGWEPGPRSLDRASAYDKVHNRIGGLHGVVARLARALLQRLRELTADIDVLTNEISTRVEQLAPSLLAVYGCGPLTAGKILAETAGVDRFTSRNAYARYTGTAPLPVWSSNHARHRLSRIGNHQLNAALHRIALTQIRCHPPAQAMFARRKANGDGGLEALRVLKRRLSDVVYTALRADLHLHHQIIAA
jgi:transposase